MLSGKTQLEKRGIADIAHRAQWEPFTHQQRNGWRYPVFDASGEVIAYRWKSADSSDSRKYLWIPGKPDNPAADWYILPDTDSAINRAGGEVYLANGEPSLLAYHAAGVHNVITTTLSEISVPKNTLEMLRSLGVTRLLYPVDNDAAGRTSAIKWREALRESGIDFQAFSWGEDVPRKADANDIWMQVNFDRDTFQAHLTNLPPLDLPAPTPKQAFQFDASTFDETPSGLVQAIISAAEALGYRGRGEWINGQCLFHDDEEASAGIHTESGVCKCFVCGNHSSWDVARLLGIDPHRFYPSRTYSRRTSEPDQTRPDLFDHDNALHALWNTSYDIGYLVSHHINGSHPEYINNEGQVQGGVLSFVLNALPKGKASLVWVQWWCGYVRQEIPAVITAPELAEHLQIDPRTIRSALNDIEQLVHNPRSLTPAELDALRNYTQHRGIENISGLLSPGLVSKSPGRQPTAYALLPQYALEELREAAKSVVFARLNASVPQIPTGRMANRTGDYETAKTWKEVMQELTKNDPDARRTFYQHRTLFEGNHADWEGLFALQQRDDWFMNVQSCESTRELRVTLYRGYIEIAGNQNRRLIYQYLLGCTSSELERVMDKADIKSIPQHIEVEIPRNQPLEDSIRQVQRQHKGKVMDVELHSSRRSLVTLSVFDPDYLEHYEEFAADTEKIVVVMRVASIHEPMTEDEIAEKERQKAEKAAQKAAEAALSQPEKASEPQNTDKQSDETPPKQLYPVMRDDDPRFVRQQLFMSIERYTPYRVNHRGAVVDTFGQVQLSATATIRSLLRFFLGALSANLASDETNLSPTSRACLESLRNGSENGEYAG